MKVGCESVKEGDRGWRTEVGEQRTRSNPEAELNGRPFLSPGARQITTNEKAIAMQGGLRRGS